VKQQNSASEQIYRVTLLMVVLNSIGTAMMLTGVNVALPTIARDLKIDAVVLTWIPMSYLMAVTACVLSFGRLADMYSRRDIDINRDRTIGYCNYDDCWQIGSRSLCSHALRY